MFWRLWRKCQTPWPCYSKSTMQWRLAEKHNSRTLCACRHDSSWRADQESHCGILGEYVLPKGSAYVSKKSVGWSRWSALLAWIVGGISWGGQFRVPTLLWDCNKVVWSTTDSSWSANEHGVWHRHWHRGWCAPSSQNSWGACLLTSTHSELDVFKTACQTHCSANSIGAPASSDAAYAAKKFRIVGADSDAQSSHIRCAPPRGQIGVRMWSSS